MSGRGRRSAVARPLGWPSAISGGFPHMPRLHRSAAAVTGAATLTLAALMAPPLAVAASGSPAPATHGKDASSNTKAASDQVHREHFDSRRDGKAGEALTQKAARNAAKPRAQVASLKKSLGTQGLVTIDPLTGSPRQIARADGFLTGPSKARARDIALGYVRANHGVVRPRRVGPRGADAAQGLRRRRRDAPPLVRPAGQGDPGLRQRAPRPRDQGRPAHRLHRLAAHQPLRASRGEPARSTPRLRARRRSRTPEARPRR